MHLVGAFKNYLGIDAPKKLEIDAPVVEIRPLADEYNAEVVRWYDHWLKGIDTGIMDEAPIRFWVNGAAVWRTETEWPLARTQWTKLYLQRWEGLGWEPEATPGKPDAFVQQPPDETDELKSVKYVSERLEEDLEVTGPVACTLYAAIDQADTNWFLSLRDVQPSGKEVELTKGFLKASHRALDEARSTPSEPYHPHTGTEPVVPGEIVEYAIALSPMSNVFKAGHRIKFVISCMDHARARDYELAPESLGRTHSPWHLCSSKTTLHKIHHDTARPTHLLLPVIPGQG
jgi:predicted acyl esterase